MNKQLALKFYKLSYSRWAKMDQPIDPEIFTKLVVDECIKVIKETKGPSKLVAINNIRKHFEYSPEIDQDESVQV